MAKSLQSSRVGGRDACPALLALVVPTGNAAMCLGMELDATESHNRLSLFGPLFKSSGHRRNLPLLLHADFVKLLPGSLLWINEGVSLARRCTTLPATWWCSVRPLPPGWPSWWAGHGRGLRLH